MPLSSKYSSAWARERPSSRAVALSAFAAWAYFSVRTRSRASSSGFGLVAASRSRTTVLAPITMRASNRTTRGTTTMVRWQCHAFASVVEVVAAQR
jgi:hypothetical protein